MQHLFCAAVTVVSAFLVYSVCRLLPDSGLAGLFIKGAAAFFLGNLCLLAAYHRTERFRDALRFVKSMIGF